MALRTREYKSKTPGKPRVRAVRLTEKNIHDIVVKIVRDGQLASAHQPEYQRADGTKFLDTKVRIKQRTNGKLGWRVARVGDFFVKHEDGTWTREKDDAFEAAYQLA